MNTNTTNTTATATHDGEQLTVETFTRRYGSNMDAIDYKPGTALEAIADDLRAMGHDWDFAIATDANGDEIGVIQRETDAPARHCVLCGSIMGEFIGNDPAPLADDGECCDRCMEHVVLPRRREDAEQSPATLHGIERFRAYLDFLAKVYGLDDDGLGRLCGLDGRAVAVARSADSWDVSTRLVMELARVSRVSCDWLMR